MKFIDMVQLTTDETTILERFFDLADKYKRDHPMDTVMPEIILLWHHQDESLQPTVQAAGDIIDALRVHYQTSITKIVERLRMYVVVNHEHVQFTGKDIYMV